MVGQNGKVGLTQRNFFAVEQLTHWKYNLCLEIQTLISHQNLDNTKCFDISSLSLLMSYGSYQIPHDVILAYLRKGADHGVVRTDRT
jgi:hypothetical protein